MILDTALFSPAHISRLSLLQPALEPQIWPDRTRHVNSVHFAPSHHSHTSLSTCCFSHEPLHTPLSWWPATAITVEFWRSVVRTDSLPVLISVTVDRCWAWRMERPLVVDRKWRGPRERDPASTRSPWRIRTNRYVFRVFLCFKCVWAHKHLVGWSEHWLVYLF